MMTPRPHLVDDLQRIDALIGLIAARSAESLDRALHAFLSQDAVLAKEVKAQDSDIDALQIQIEDLAGISLATQQPVARDLRYLVAAIKIAGEYERAADYAAHLAKATKHFVGEPRFKQVEHLEIMARTCSRMLLMTAEAYRLRSADIAREAAALDDIVDREHKLVLAGMLAFMVEHPEKAEKAERLLLTSRYLERLGDHMTNACEDIVFMASGERMELNV
jgi:phosphate transport system protein